MYTFLTKLEGGLLSARMIITTDKCSIETDWSTFLGSDVGSRGLRELYSTMGEGGCTLKMLKTEVYGRCCQRRHVFTSVLHVFTSVLIPAL